MKGTQKDIKGQTRFVAIVGGGHCGKSSFARTLTEILKARLQPEDVCLLQESSYLEEAEGPIESKEYNYTQLANDLSVRTEKIVIVEGFYLLSRPETRLKFQHSVFLDLSDEERFDRKIKAFVEAQKTALEAYKEFHGLDKPLFDRFIAPSKVHAKKVIKSSEVLRELNKFSESLLQLI